MLYTYCFNGILLVDLSYGRLKHYSVHEFLGMKLVHDVITFNNKKFNVHKSSVVKDYVFRILIIPWKLILLRVQKLWNGLQSFNKRNQYLLFTRSLIRISRTPDEFEDKMWHKVLNYNVGRFSEFSCTIFISPKCTIHRNSITMYIIIIVSCKEQMYDNKWDEYCDSFAVQFDIYLILSSYNISQKHPITF